MTDDDHKQLKSRADNLPGALQRSKKTGLIATLRARIQACSPTPMMTGSSASVPGRINLKYWKKICQGIRRNY